MGNGRLIEVEKISKKFCRDLKRSLWYGVQSIANELLGYSPGSVRLRPQEFWALKDISFNVRKGECLGLIGCNGAGKSTLLRLLNGLIKPDEGYIKIHGRMGALIELGAGFSPLLTGRENIYVNAAILGIPKRKVDYMLENIIEFAGLEKFIDTPVQNYSSGMKVRLGFAIAAQLQPDILLIDEVLAVGDFGFQAKCYAKVNMLKKSGVASILVSHNMAHIMQYADSCLWIHHGEINKFGDPQEVCAAYLEYIHSERQSIAERKSGRYFDLFGGTVEERGDIKDVEVWLEDERNQRVKTISAFEKVFVNYCFAVERTCVLGITFKIHRDDGLLLAVMNTLLDEIKVYPRNGKVTGKLYIHAFNLLPGRYTIVIVIQEGVEYLYRAPVVQFTISREGQDHDLYEDGMIRIPHEWQEL